MLFKLLVLKTLCLVLRFLIQESKSIALQNEAREILKSIQDTINRGGY